jgi:hypothetical protein
MSSTIRLREITLAVQHLYRDGEDVAQALGGILRDGGWFPGTGVGHKYVDVEGMRVNVLSVVDYRASRTSELGYAVYEAARHGTALFEIGAVSDAANWREALPGRTIYTEGYRRADGLPVPSSAMFELEAGRCRVRIADSAAPAGPPTLGWRVQWGADVDWAAAAAGLGFGSESGAAQTTVTGDLGVSFRAPDQGALMLVRRN